MQQTDDADPLRQLALRVREARLRPEFEHLYPGLPPGAWIPAAEVSARMIFEHYVHMGPEAFARRPLDEQHFEFRGGWTRGAVASVHTRATDADAGRVP